MSSSNPNRHHLIWSYFVESTGIVEVFRALFKSYLESDDMLKLNHADDSVMINRIKESINNNFPIPSSSISPDPEGLRYNAYWRLFGYVIHGKESILTPELKPSSSNMDFNSNLEKILYEIFQIILDKDITIEKLGNPSGLALLLNDLGKQLHNRTYNQIEDVAEYWYLNFKALREFIKDDDLMVKRLNVRSTGEDQRLIELGERLKVPVALKTVYLFVLAEQMQNFLKKIEDTTAISGTGWDSTTATMLSDPHPEFGFDLQEIDNAWFQVTGKDPKADAIAARRGPTAVVPH